MSGPFFNLRMAHCNFWEYPDRCLLGGRYGHHNSSDRYHRDIAYRWRRLVRPRTLVLGSLVIGGRPNWRASFTSGVGPKPSATAVESRLLGRLQNSFFGVRANFPVPLGARRKLCRGSMNSLILSRLKFDLPGDFYEVFGRKVE
jgi:hypothetical protein